MIEQDVIEHFNQVITYSIPLRNYTRINSKKRDDTIQHAIENIGLEKICDFT